MSPIKIIRILALAVAVIAAFVTIPYAALIMVVLGLALGFMGVEEERRVAFLVAAIALSIVAGSLGPIPAVGEYLTSILTNLSAILNAGAVAVILTVVKEKVME
jgi:hypothetical protein